MFLYAVFLACLLGPAAGVGSAGPVVAPGDITTVAGGGGEQGPALSTAQVPAGVVVSGPFVYVADFNFWVVRRIDTRIGYEVVVAGTGTQGFSGDGGPATNAQLNWLVGVGVDLAGNVLIADATNNRVRKVDHEGTITTIAGTGDGGFSGDGGPATSAQLNNPLRVAVDQAGNLFIADAGNQRIRKVDLTGTITTVAGSGTQGFAGDGGPATSAELNQPSGVAVDAAGNLFIADTGNHRVRKVDPDGTITTVAGTGAAGVGGDGGPGTAAQLSGPSGLAVDAVGNLFIADQGNNRVRKVDLAGTITTVAGGGCRSTYCNPGFGGDGGPATSALLNDPTGVAVDPDGNLFIADPWNGRVRKVDTAGTITTIAGNGITTGGGTPPTFGGDGGLATSAILNGPTVAVADMAGNFFIADAGNQRIRKVDPAGTITTIAGGGSPPNGLGDGGLATGAQLNNPAGAAVDKGGQVFIADSGYQRVRKVDAAGTITTVAGTCMYGCYGSFSGDGGPATNAHLNNPVGVAVDTAGNLFIADKDNQRIRKVDRVGTITTVAGTGDQDFGGDGGPATSAHLNLPSSVAVNAAGDLFIADSGNNRIRKIDTAGTIITVAGNGDVICFPFGGCHGGFGGDGGPATAAQLNNPVGVAVDPTGNLFIADSGNQRIRKVDTTGTITTVAGNGTQGFSGDGRPATSAQLNGPSGVAVDRAGNLLIADAGNNRIRYEYNAPPDCCQCPASCAAPIDGSCGACIGVYDATCESEDLCVLHTPTPSLTPTPSSTPTPTMPTPTPTLTPTNTPGENDCCQCADFCAAPIVGTCGGCAAVYRASCASGGRCISWTPTAVPTPTPWPCVGDCNGDGAVGVDELVTMVNIALGKVQPSVCVNGGAADISLIIQAVNAALNGCLGPPAPEVTIDTYPAVDGSTSTLPLARLIACELLGLSYRWEPYRGPEGESEIVPVATTPAQEALAAQVLERIVFNKTHQAYLNLVDGVADLITVANPPSPEERAYADQHGVTLVWEPLALDALVIVLNAANPVHGLMTEQIQRIFTAELTNWSEVGGTASTIDPYVRPENSGSQQLFNTIVMQGRPMAEWPPDRVFAGMGGLIDRIRTDPLAIGYSVYYWVTYQYPSEGYSVIAVDGIAPTAETIGARSYPFTADVWIVTRSNLDQRSLAHQLHDWMLSPDGQKAVARSGYVPIIR